MDISSPAFWAALGSIILADIVLSGDNAVVIAMAVRSLPARQQRRAIAFGTLAAIALRVALTVVAVELLKLAYLKIAGGVLLAYIGISLLVDSDREGGKTGRPVSGGMLAAIRTILIADVVMSLDNVIAVAAAARGNLVLLALGLAISIPPIIVGSTMLLGAMERYPIIVTAGAAVLGFLAGEMMFTDPAIARHLGALARGIAIAAGVAGAVLVVSAGLHLQRRAARGRAGD